MEDPFGPLASDDDGAETTMKTPPCYSTKRE